tara:strand:- start:1848 stop:2312 length:465 start_codon:yes stop_codon:yes gene_type:complete
MKYYTRLKEYKASNVSLTVEPKLEAYSYAWWLFLVKYKGLVIFNNTNYSSSTSRHQRKVRRVLYDLNIKIDIELNNTRRSFGKSYGLYAPEPPSDGDFVKAAIKDEIVRIGLINKNLADLIQKPRTRKSTNEKRAQQIKKNKNQIKKLKKVLED